jgi:hypothetical protein
MLDCVRSDADVGLAIARQHGVAAIGVAGTAREVAAGHMATPRRCRANDRVAGVAEEALIRA